jgi:hypothetical protein
MHQPKQLVDSQMHEAIAIHGAPCLSAFAALKRAGLA